jgi:peptidoglycan/LPS O-acetylase OafA/YrhL
VTSDVQRTAEGLSIDHDDVDKKGHLAPAPRVAFVDWLRAAAALYVATYHALLIIWPAGGQLPPWYLRWANYGHFAVTVFIVLSGFSLALGPARRLDRTAGSYWKFMKKRALRLLPPYWLALFGSVLLLEVAPRGLHAVTQAGEWSGKGPVPVHSVAVFFLLLQDMFKVPSPNSPFWSIAVEWHLYFLFPLLILLAGRYGLRWLVAGSIVVGVALHFVLLDTSAIGTTPQFLALFCFGIAAAYGMMRFRLGGEGRGWVGLPRRVGSVGQRRAGWTLMSIALIVFMVMSQFEMEADIVAGGLFTIGLFWVGCGATEAGETQPTRRLGRAMGMLGLFSYSIYLVHSPTEKVVWTLGVSRMGLDRPEAFAVMVILGVGAAVAAAYLFYLIIERRSQEWSKRVSMRRNAPDTVRP